MSKLNNKIRTFLSLGSNLGDSQQILNNACRLLQIECGTLSLISPSYISAPWGYESANDFYNQVVAIETSLEPEELLFATQKIELELGRVEKSKNGYTDRPIDIDILLYGDIVFKSPILNIPHKELANRRFVLQPLADIAPEVVVPKLNVIVSDLLASTNDKGVLKQVVEDVEIDE